MAHSKTKGLERENLVAQHLRERGWSIIYRNKKVLGVEIDILAQKEKDLALIEVKSIGKKEHIGNILKTRQKERLKKAGESLCSEFPEGLRLFLATVDTQDDIHFFEIL